MHDMEPRQQIKWAGNGDGRNVRLGVRLTRESLDYAQGVLSNRNYTFEIVTFLGKLTQHPV